MTKAEIVSRIAQQTGIEKEVVMTVVEAFMENVKDAMIAGNEVFLRVSVASLSSKGQRRWPVTYQRTQLL